MTGKTEPGHVRRGKKGEEIDSQEPKAEAKGKETKKDQDGQNDWVM